MFQGWSQTCFVAGWNIQEIEVEGVADGDDPGGKGGSCGWTEAVDEACFRVSLKHASLWFEIFKKLRLKGLQMEMILGKMGVVVGGQRPCTKHVSGLVSNMLRCVLKYSRKWGWRGCFHIYMCIFLIHAGQLPTVFCGRLQPYRLQEKGVAFGSAGSPCVFFVFFPSYVLFHIDSCFLLWPAVSWKGSQLAPQELR